MKLFFDLKRPSIKFVFGKSDKNVNYSETISSCFRDLEGPRRIVETINPE